MLLVYIILLCEIDFALFFIMKFMTSIICVKIHMISFFFTDEISARPSDVHSHGPAAANVESPRAAAWRWADYLFGVSGLASIDHACVCACACATHAYGHVYVHVHVGLQTYISGPAASIIESPRAAAWRWADHLFGGSVLASIVHACVCACACACVWACVWACVCTCVWACVCTCVWACVCTCGCACRPSDIHVHRLAGAEQPIYLAVLSCVLVDGDVD